MLNQLLSGHTLLNQHRARIDDNVSEICTVCLVLEDPDHFLLYCIKHMMRNKENGREGRRGVK